MKKSRAYVPSVPTRYDPINKIRTPIYNLESAAEYGIVTPLVSISESLDQYSFSELANQVRHGLSHMQEQDYIVCIGDPVLIGIAMNVALKLFGRTRILRWDKVRKQYTELEVKG